MNNIRGFPIYEFQQRLLKLQNKMKENEIDAVLITTQSNFNYFSGLVSRFWESPTRPLYLIVKQNLNTPLAIVPDLLLKSMEKTFVKHIYTWDAPCLEDDGVSLLKKHLYECNRVGLCMGVETELRMSLGNLFKVKDYLDFDLIDVTEIIQNIRLVKSDLEINKIKNVCQITSKYFEDLPNYLKKINHKHLTERMVVNEFQQLLLKNGVDTVKYIVGRRGKNGYCSVVDGPTDELLEANDIFVIDTGAVYDEYFCDFDRNYTIIGNDYTVVGNSHTIIGNDCTVVEQLERYKKANHLLWEATEKAFEMIKPNIRVKDI